MGKLRTQQNLKGEDLQGVAEACSEQDSKGQRRVPVSNGGCDEVLLDQRGSRGEHMAAPHR